MRYITMLCLLLVFTGIAEVDAQTTIVPGSVINITVLGNSELSQTVIVKPDGTTDYPLLGSFNVSGLNAERLEDILIKIVSHILDRPRVFVSISDFSMVTIRVKGAVKNPGELTIKSPADIVDVISESGGSLEEADLRRIMIISGPDNDISKVTTTVDLMEYAKFREDGYDPILVEMGDLIVVPTLKPESYVKVIGEVRIPGNYIPQEEANLVDLIYMAGGPSRYADLKDVRLIHKAGSHLTETAYDIRQLLSSEYDLPFVEPGDVIIVGYLNEYKRFSFWASLTRDLALLASSLILLTRI